MAKNKIVVLDREKVYTKIKNRRLLIYSPRENEILVEFKNLTKDKTPAVLHKYNDRFGINHNAIKLTKEGAEALYFSLGAYLKECK